MQFVIIHGSFGNPRENWFPYLKKELEKRKQKVFAPEFPVDDWDEFSQTGKAQNLKKQSLTNWLNTFAKIVPQLPKNEPFCFVAHSLGPVFTLHAVQTFDLKLDVAIFVAPFLEKLHSLWQIDTANETFYKTDFDFADLRKRIPHSYAIYSENDPYVKPKYVENFANKMGSEKIQITDGGHFNTEAGFTTFPQVLELCTNWMKTMR